MPNGHQPGRPNACGPAPGARQRCAGTFGFPIDAAANVALRTVITHLEGETGIERVTFVLRGDAQDAFRRRLATL